MTFSVVERDPRTGDIGVAVASKFLAVDALVPFVKSGVGAVATQSYVNPNFGPDGLALRVGGQAPQDVAAHFQAQDTDIGQRQFGRVDLQGRSATLTGGDGHGWAGSWAGPGRGDSGQPAGRARGGRRHARGLGSRGHAAPPPPPAVCPAGRRRGRRRPSRAAVGGPGVRRAGAGVRGPDRRLCEPACRRPRRSLRRTGAAAETARLCCLGARRRAGRWRRRSWAGCAPC